MSLHKSKKFMQAKARILQQKSLDPDAVQSRVSTAVFGETCDVPGYEYGTKGFVETTSELKRIHGMPRENWEDRDDLKELVDILTETYGIGTQRLWPNQAVALETLHDHNGVFISSDVGSGKTLMSWLAGAVMGSERTAIVVPSALRDDKTPREFAELAEHWEGPKDYKIFGYQGIGTISGAKVLEEYAPDLIVLDEVHFIKNVNAARTKRILRYIVQNEPTVMCMTGTDISGSLMDLHHLLLISLGPSKSPLPAWPDEAHTWARSVDEGVETRTRPGALARFLPEGVKPSLRSIRKAVGRRIYESEGVVQFGGMRIGSSISMDFKDHALGEETDAKIRDMIDTKIGPDGQEITPMDIYRHMRTMVLGFYHEWEPRPSDLWFETRRTWNGLVSDVLLLADANLDSELRIKNAIRRNEMQPYYLQILKDWEAQNENFEVKSEPRWISDEPLLNIAKDVKDGSIVWVEHREAGRKMSEILGVPYFGQKGLDTKGNYIEDASGTIVASIKANITGRNLQHKWHRNAIVTPPPDAETWQQLLGRMHRPLQLNKIVFADVFLGHEIIQGHFARALRGAKFLEDIRGKPQKLCNAKMSRVF
jgi:hypothetical protein